MYLEINGEKRSIEDPETLRRSSHIPNRTTHIQKPTIESDSYNAITVPVSMEGMVKNRSSWVGSAY